MVKLFIFFKFFFVLLFLEFVQFTSQHMYPKGPSSVVRENK